MRFTLKQLGYFLAAGEHESITGAARAIHVSQASISAAVSQLESVFGIQLCVRHHAQGLSLTPAGRELLGEARRLLAHANELQLHAKTLGGTVSGTLDIGCFLTVAPAIMPRLIRRFQAAFPEVTIACSVGNQEELHAGLRDGRFPVALTYDLQLTDDIVFRPLARLPPYAILPRDHALAARATLRLADLAPEPMVLLDLPLSREYFLSLFYSKGLEPRIAHRFAATDMVKGMVANGFGYALLNAPLAVKRALDGKGLLIRELDDGLRPLRLGLAWRADVKLTRAAEAFLEHSRKHTAAALGMAG
jgi:DNA-binding transcriptional LysR family regulator